MLILTLSEELTTHQITVSCIYFVSAVIYTCCILNFFLGSQSDEEKLKQQSMLEKVRKVSHSLCVIVLLHLLFNYNIPWSEAVNLKWIFTVHIQCACISNKLVKIRMSLFRCPLLLEGKVIVKQYIHVSNKWNCLCKITALYKSSLPFDWDRETQHQVHH